MIEHGWPYIWAAYALTLAGLAGLAVLVWLRLRTWARRARAVDAGKREASP